MEIPRIQYAVCSERLQKPYAYAPFTGAVDVAAELQQRLQMPIRLELAPHTLGVSASEINYQRREWMARYLRKREVEIDGIHWTLAGGEQLYGVRGIQPDLVQPEDGRDLAVLCLHEGQKLLYDLGEVKKGGMIVVGSPAQRKIPESMSKEDAYRYAASVINCSLNGTNAWGVVIAPEMLTQEEDNFCTSPDEYGLLLETIGNPRVKPMGDNKAILGVGADPGEFIQRFGPLARYHANEPDKNLPGFPGGVYNPECAYDFSNPFYAIISDFVAEKTAPEECRISIEHFTDPAEDGEPLTWMQKSLRFLLDCEARANSL